MDLLDRMLAIAAPIQLHDLLECLNVLAQTSARFEVNVHRSLGFHSTSCSKFF